MKKAAQKPKEDGAHASSSSRQHNKSEVSRRAYELWEAGGCQHGDDMSHSHVARDASSLPLKTIKVDLS